MDAPRTETLIPLQRDWWKRKLLKKAANSDIASGQNTTESLEDASEVMNILMRMMTQAELESSDNSFFTKIIQAKQTKIQDCHANNRTSDPEEHNEEPLD